MLRGRETDVCKGSWAGFAGSRCWVCEVGVWCVKLVFSIAIILFVGIKGPDRWFLREAGGGTGFPSTSVSLQNVYPAKDILIFS